MSATILTFNNIIYSALRKIGAYDQNATPAAFKITNALAALTALVYDLQNESDFPWVTVDETETFSGTATNSFGVDTDTIAIVYAFMRDTSDIDHPLQVISYEEYLEYTVKDAEAEFPNVIAYDPLLSGNCYLYPAVNTDDNTLYYRRVREVDFSGTTPETPKRWDRALIYLLAADLADEYGKSMEERMYLHGKAEALKLKATLGNSTRETMTVLPYE
jgi:hypothetical protein